MNIGHQVRLARLDRGLTQQKLADLSGVGLNFVYQLEKNKESIQLDSLQKVLKTLGFKLDLKKSFDPWEKEKPSDPWVERPQVTAMI